MKWTPVGMNNFLNGKTLYFNVYSLMTYMPVKEYKWKNSLGLGAESWHVLYILTSVWVLRTPNPKIVIFSIFCAKKLKKRKKSQIWSKI